MPAVRVLFLLLVLVLLAGAAPPPKPWLAVAAGDEVILVDPQELKIVQTLEDLDAPHVLAVSPDRRWLACCRPDRDQVQILDLSSKKVHNLEGASLLGPCGLAFSADGKKLWVLSGSLKALVELEPGLGKVTQTLALEGPEPTALVPRPDGRTLLLVSPAGALAEVDPQSFAVVRHDRLASKLVAAQWLGYDRLLVALETPQARVLDAGRERPLTVNLPAPAVAIGPPGLAVTKEQLVRFDTDTGETAWQLAVGSHPVALATSPDGRWAYVADADSRDLQVVDLLTGAEKTRVALQRTPAAMVWVP